MPFSIFLELTSIFLFTTFLLLLDFVKIPDDQREVKYKSMSSNFQRRVHTFLDTYSDLWSLAKFPITRKFILINTIHTLILWIHFDVKDNSYARGCAVRRRFKVQWKVLTLALATGVNERYKKIHNASQ